MFALLILVACDNDLHLAVLGDRDGDLKHIGSSTCFLKTFSGLAGPELEMTLFPRGGRGFLGPAPDHPDVFSFTLHVPLPPLDGTRVGAHGTIGEVVHLDGLAYIGGEPDPVEGALTYSSGIPETDICGGGVSCAIQDRELFVHQLYVPEAEHPHPSGTGTYTFGGELFDLRTYCLDDRLVLEGG